MVIRLTLYSKERLNGSIPLFSLLIPSTGPKASFGGQSISDGPTRWHVYPSYGIGTDTLVLLSSLTSNRLLSLSASSLRRLSSNLFHLPRFQIRCTLDLLLGKRRGSLESTFSERENRFGSFRSRENVWT